MEIITTEQEFYERMLRRLLHIKRALLRLNADLLKSPFAFDIELYQSLDDAAFQVGECDYYLYTALMCEVLPDGGFTPKKSPEDNGTLPDDTSGAPF